MDSGVNLSDHRPLVAEFAISEVFHTPAQNQSHRDVAFSWRWDKADISLYKAQSRACLAHVSLPKDCFACVNCRDNNHLVEINTYYNAIISALRDSANVSIPRITFTFFETVLE